MKSYPISLSKQKGAVLLESLVAILVFSFGVLALAGLQAAMIKNTDAAKFRAEASFIAQDKLSEIWLAADPVPANNVVTDDPVPQLPQGKVSVAVAGDATYTITVNWTPPGGTEHSYSTNTRVEGF